MEIEDLHETIKCPAFVRRLNVLIFKCGFIATWNGEEDPFSFMENGVNMFVAFIKKLGVSIEEWDYENGQYYFFSESGSSLMEKKLKSLPFLSVFCYYNKENGIRQLK